MLEKLSILRYECYNGSMRDNATGAENQQGSPLFTVCKHDPSETTRRAPFPKCEIRAYLQGALHDASLNKGKRYRFTQSEKRWLEVIKQSLEALGYASWIYREGKTRHVFALETLATFLDFSFNPLALETREEKTAYIRGFFDAEGGIPRISTAKFYIQLVQKDKKKIKKIVSILNVLEIRTGKVHNPSVRVDPNFWRVFVSTNSHKVFAQTIGSWHPRKVGIFKERMMI